MKLSRVLTLTLLAGAAAAASAQSMKPGLWEINNKMQSGNGQMEAAMAKMQQQMASMSPEQRKMMEDAMARQGVNVGGPSAGGGMTIKMCMTKEMADRNDVPSQHRGDCKSTASPRVGNTMKISYSCTNPPSSGEGEYTFMGDTGYAMKMTTNTTVQGKPEKVTMEATGKWLSADCGSVKPIQIPKQ